MEARDWLLLFLSNEALGLDTQAIALDPIRIQKGMFLLSRRGPARNLYHFKPYNWGPFSKAIYSDLEALEDDGLVESNRVPGRTWRIHRVTRAGEDEAKRLAAKVKPENLNWLADTRRFVTDRSFVGLLREVYREYPEFRKRSLLR